MWQVIHVRRVDNSSCEKLIIYQKFKFYGRKNIKNLKSKQHKMSLFKRYYYYYDIKSFLHILTN